MNFGFPCFEFVWDFDIRILDFYLRQKPQDSPHPAEIRNTQCSTASPWVPLRNAPKSQTLRTVEAIAYAKAIGKEIDLSIDGNPIKVPLGTTILEAADQLGIRIPTLCYHEDLCLAGVCRVCVVEIQGQRTLQAGVQLPDHRAYPGENPLRRRAQSPAAHYRSVAQRPLGGVLYLRAEQQLRAPGVGHGVRR